MKGLALKEIRREVTSPKCRGDKSPWSGYFSDEVSGRLRGFRDMWLYRGPREAGPLGVQPRQRCLLPTLRVKVACEHSGFDTENLSVDTSWVEHTGACPIFYDPTNTSSSYVILERRRATSLGQDGIPHLLGGRMAQSFD